MEFLIISGMSGAGKSSIASFLEDTGYFCVDNMPVPLIPEFAGLCMAESGNYNRVAMVTDIRGGQTFEGLFAALDTLQELECEYKILFVEASDEAIIQRYKETRHSHPLMRHGHTLGKSVQLERAALEPVRSRATYIIDTTGLTNAKLRAETLRLLGPDGPGDVMNVSVLSFGFKYGIPIEADLVFDARFLPNPYYIASLKKLTGLDKNVRDFLDGYQQTREFLRHLEGLLAFLLPQYVEEGKTNLVIAVGCTGGRHRSVYIARSIAEFIRQKGYHASENHRDMARG